MQSEIGTIALLLHKIYKIQIGTHTMMLNEIFKGKIVEIQIKIGTIALSLNEISKVQIGIHTLLLNEIFEIQTEIGTIAPLLKIMHAPLLNEIR